jgi:hypothetical protein
MKNKTKKTNKTLKWVIGSVIVIALIFGMFLFRDDVNMVRDHVNTQRDYRNENYCKWAETDALNIAVTITEYFTDPEHNTLPTIGGDSKYLGYTLYSKGGQNIAWVTGDLESTITIVVQDGSGKCPESYQERFSEWNSGEYTKILD